MDSASLLLFNSRVNELMGVRVTLGSSINNTRLQPYAIVILFYLLNKTYPIFNIDYVLQVINTNTAISSIIEDIQQYESTQNV